MNVYSEKKKLLNVALYRVQNVSIS